MKTSLLFSSYPFISGEKVTLTRVTDMDAEALWLLLSDEDTHRFTPEGQYIPPGNAPPGCASSTPCSKSAGAWCWESTPR